LESAKDSTSVVPTFFHLALSLSVVLFECFVLVSFIQQRLSILAKGVGLARDEDTNDETEETENGAENLNDKNLDETVLESVSCSNQGHGGQMCAQSSVGSISQSRAAAIDANADTADEVAHANGDAGPEKREAGVVGVGRVSVGPGDGVHLGGEDDGHDDAVDGDDLAENDGEQVLGSNSRGPDAGTQDG
jgi:hypothetical protein